MPPLRKTTTTIRFRLCTCPRQGVCNQCAPVIRSSRGWGLARVMHVKKRMLFLVVLLIVLWLLGMMTTYTLGGLLHILLVIAVIMFLVHIIQGRPIGG